MPHERTSEPLGWEVQDFAAWVSGSVGGLLGSNIGIISRPQLPSFCSLSAHPFDEVPGVLPPPPLPAPDIKVSAGIAPSPIPTGPES